MHHPAVAILVDTATDWGRRLIRGVINYARGHGAWQLWVEPRGQAEHLVVPHGWRGQGVIARVGTPRIAAELTALRRDHGTPVVNVSGIRLDGVDFPRVTTDYAATARLAAEHFLDRGYRRLAYVGPLGLAHVRAHAEAFREVAAQSGEDCALFDDGADAREQAVGETAGAAWAERRHHLGAWLGSLAKPVGIFSWATSAGARVLDLCRELRIPTPDDVAVLAGDDDPLLCDTTAPPLSGVLVASERIGFRAAARLDHLMRWPGRAEADGTPELVDPITITTRGSTEALAIEDPELRAAMTFLRANAYRAVTVDRIADAVPMARRSLERKFRAALGRTPLEEIRRLRLARVRQLLATTDWSIDEIARDVGFGTPEYMTAVFREAERITPLKYRRRVRGV